MRISVGNLMFNVKYVISYFFLGNILDGGDKVRVGRLERSIMKYCLFNIIW